MAKTSINNIQAPSGQQASSSMQPNALQQMATPQAPQTQVNPAVQAPMAATAAQASPMKSLVPQPLTSLVGQAQPAQPNALGQMASAKPQQSQVQQKGASSALSAAAAQAQTGATNQTNAPMLGTTKSGANNQMSAPTNNLPSNQLTMASQGNANTILPGSTNTALSDFAKNVGGQYAGTPWSNALQESLNQYSQVWEQTKQALSQQYRDNNLSAATNAAASGFTPFGAASADLNRQAATNNYKALNEATTNYGTGLTNIMGQYGQNALNAQTTDVNNANAMDRMIQGINLQDAHAQDRLTQELAAQPKAPGLDAAAQNTVLDTLKKNDSTVKIGYDSNSSIGSLTVPDVVTYSDGSTVSIPTGMMNALDKRIGIALLGGGLGAGQGGTAQAYADFRTKSAQYYAAYIKANNGNPPTQDEMISYLGTLGFNEIKS